MNDEHTDYNDNEEKKKKNKKTKQQKDPNAQRLRKVTLKKDHLRREIQFGRANTRKGNRELVSSEQIRQIKEECEILGKKFDRALDIKEHRANELVDAIQKDEEIYRRNWGAHARTIDRIVEIYEWRVRQYDVRYRNDLENLVTTLREKGYRRIEARAHEDRLSMQSIVFASKRRIDQLILDVRSVAIAKLDVLKEKDENTRRENATILENEMGERWRELRRVLADYENETRQRRRTYEFLRAKDDRERIVMTRQLSTTTFLLDTIRTIKEKIGRFKVTADKTISEIMAEHGFFHDAYHSAKQLFDSDRKKDGERLLVLTKEYNLTVERLKKLVKKAEKILILVRDCSKYETEDEKILQPSSLIITRDDGSIETPRDEIFDDLRHLEFSFWKRVGAARIITTELGSEKLRLCQEFRSLRESLHHRLSEQNYSISG